MTDQAKRPSMWLWICGVLALAGGAFLWAAWSHGRDLEERDQLALRLADLDGNQTCNLAWLKAVDLGLDDGRTPSVYAPETEVVGPPRIISCGMLQTGGAPADPLRVIVRCREVSLACVDLPA